MNNLLEQLFKDDTKKAYPISNISESENSYIVEVMLPGVKKKDINLSYDSESLKISASCNLKDDKRKYHLFENYTGELERHYRFSNVIDEDGITASFKDGVLSVSLLKKGESPKKAITIK